MVEGVEADDYASTGSLLSVMKLRDRKHMHSDRDIPPGYEIFNIVNFRDEIHAPRSPNCLAVKITDSNFADWAVHASLRALQKKFLATRPAAQPTVGVKKKLLKGQSNNAQIVQVLLHFGATKKSEPGAEVSFTPDRKANELVRTDAFAFLLAVIFDQGIPAERAWQAPYELKRRLGHLDPHRISKDRASVEAAVKGPPCLHRYVFKVPKWIVLAAIQVVQEYAGDASAIWNDRPTAKAVYERLNSFAGIGQKKAAMAVEILERDLKVTITRLEESDIAYDVHVRRVMLRTRLAERDNPNHMIEVARKLHPERPGALDSPLWYIGRQWCHPGTPDCSNCVLSQLCPKEIYRASNVKGN